LLQARRNELHHRFGILILDALFQIPDIMKAGVEQVSQSLLQPEQSIPNSISAMGCGGSDANCEYSPCIFVEESQVLSRLLQSLKPP